jgi:hypothetical protein
VPAARCRQDDMALLSKFNASSFSNISSSENFISRHRIKTGTIRVFVDKAISSFLRGYIWNSEPIYVPL